MNRSNMRNAGIVWMAVLVLGLVFARPVRAEEAASKGPILSALTEKPLVVFHLNGITGAVEAIAQTRVGQQIGESPLLSSALDVWQGGLRFGAAVLADLPEETLHRLLGREMAVVVFAPQEPAEELVALVMHLGEDTDLVKDLLKERIIPRLKATNPRLQVQVRDAKGGHVVQLEDGPKRGHLRFAEDLLIAGPENVLMKFDPAGRTPTRVTEERGTAQIASVSVNLEPVWHWVMARVAGHPAAAARVHGIGLLAMTQLRVATAVEAGGFKDTLVADIDPNAPAHVRARMAIKAGQARSAAVIPAGSALAVSLQIESGDRLYALIEDSIRQKQGEAGLQQFRQRLDAVNITFGVNVELGLMPAIGNEVFLALIPPDADAVLAGEATTEDFGYTIGFVAKDADKLRDIIQRFAAAPPAVQAGWRLITDRFQGADVYNLVNDVEQKRLSLAFVEGFLIFSAREDSVRDAVSAVAAGEVLAACPQYQAVLDHLPDEANARLYVDTRPLRELLMAVLPQRAPQQVKAFLPLIEGVVPHLGSYGVAAVSDETQLRVEGYGDVPAMFALFNLGLGAAADRMKKAGPMAPAAADGNGRNSQRS
ncbi:MAG: DUF3352 domain-containing protein [Candidatus Brocadiae bacterium]|nr:DUF3352 domain-containing protein [Candidatus Brocadiia bacterium]